MNEARVQITSDGLDQKITINGHDVSSSVLSAQLKLAAGNLATLVLELTLYQDGDIADADARVIIPPETAAALKRLGWTAPKHQHH